QNEPNPFGNSTIIRYYVPESVKEAMLVFYDEFGREISKELLNQKGYSKVDVDAEKLASGLYTYSIVVDGKIADTKRMIKAK
ncbi:MAG: T9SS type A sorting domain-containing protein, partial [Bacteroidia bacterium]|nr:T9SS type A sorting domain-containing protein [Bacteroidia bacterium]